MLIEITTTERPATDLGYLLYKNPSRAQAFELSFGRAHVFYPEASADRCTAALLVEVDPVALSRGRRANESPLEPYVNDRPYVASSFLSVAIGEVFGTALSGQCKDRPELAAREIPLVIRLPVVPCRGGEAFARRLFEPLGYTVAVARLVLDALHPEWGESAYYTIELTTHKRLSEALAQLCVLLPVLDARKHYWVGQDEVDKLLRRGDGWLSSHPEREPIALRYLLNQRSLTRSALDRLVAEDALDDDGVVEAAEEAPISVREPTLNEQRMQVVVETLRDSGAARVVDLGCGEGKLLLHLLRERQFTEILGVDVSTRALQIAAERLHLDRLTERQRERIRLLQGSLTYRDSRLTGFDAAAVVEVIEHLEPHRLAAFEDALFGVARPATVLVTTPNAEHNVRYPGLAEGEHRHADHRFEWTRAEFTAWADGVAERHGYTWRHAPIGVVDHEVGAPTQMAVFTR